MSLVDEVKERTDIVDLVQSYFPLQKAGRNFKALCPFHNERTPSFIVSPERRSWHCFGACSTGGDVFNFVMRMEHLDFSEALRFLARRAGIDLSASGGRSEAEDQERKRLYEIQQAAAQFYSRLLKESSQVQHAREYLAQREIDMDSWGAFQLGYSPNEWDGLLNHLKARGYKEEDLAAAGLLVERTGGGYYDRFRGRLMFAIRDTSGRVIGFGARSLGDEQPKYLNSPETPIFTKGHVLFGIDLAKAEIRKQEEAILVEGYTDVIMAHQRGFKNVVASMGTALTESQLRTLSRLAKRIVLALDADVAGDAAVLRGIQVAAAALKERTVPVPLGRRLIRYESRMEAEIRIAALPAGRDPDEIIREDPQNWADLIAASQPVMDYYLSLAPQRWELSTARGKSQAAREILPLIQELPSEVEREHYLQKLARLLRIDERRLRREFARGTLPQAPSASETSPPPTRGPLTGFPGFTFGLEKHILSLLLEEPLRLKLLDQYFQKLRMDLVEAEDFSEPEARQVFSLLQTRIRQNETLDLSTETVYDFALPELHEFLDQLYAFLDKIHGSFSADRRKDFVSCALRLRLKRLEREMESIRFLIEEAEPEVQKSFLMEINQRQAKVNQAVKALSQKDVDSSPSRMAEGLYFFENR